MAAWHTALRLLLRLPLPEVSVPRVPGVDDFALRRGHVYATVLMDAETGQRVDVLAGRKAEVLETWLRGHPGVQVVCRDGSGAYGEAIRRALPGAIQAGDRWHLWHGLAEAALKEVVAHSSCWAAAGPPRKADKQAQTTAERWRQVHQIDAPAARTARNAGVDARSRPAKLKPATTVQTHWPTATPAAVLIPAARPPASALRTVSVVSGPGVQITTAATGRNAANPVSM